MGMLRGAGCLGRWGGRLSLGNCFNSGECHKKERERIKFHWSYDEAGQKHDKPPKEKFMERFAEEGDDSPAARKRRMLEFLNVKDLEGEQRVIKPGDLDGYDMTFENCKDCTFYVLDISAQIQIDDCSNCAFFIAPCSGSVFLRDSRGIRLAVACAQLRLRDCSEVQMMVFVPRKSALENCRKVSIACWNTSYFQLAEQMRHARLSVFENGWHNYDDFGTNATPDFLPSSTKIEDIMCKSFEEGIWVESTWDPLHVACPSMFTSGEEAEPAIPLTIGDSGDHASCFVLVAPGRSDAALTLALHFSGGRGGAAMSLAYTKEFILPEAAVERMFPNPAKLGVGKHGHHRREVFTQGPSIGLTMTGAAAPGVARSVLRDAQVVVLGDDAADSPFESGLGQAYVWEGPTAITMAKFFNVEVKGDFAG